MQTASQKWYQNNKERVKLQARQKQVELEKIVYAAKMNPCTDCGVTYLPIQMDFDHISNDKVDNISNLVRSGNKDKLLAEIAKCELVCSNCHRLRTWVRYKKPYPFSVLVSETAPHKH